jgi:hypothetical protein
MGRYNRPLLELPLWKPLAPREVDTDTRQGREIRRQDNKVD